MACDCSYLAAKPLGDTGALPVLIFKLYELCDVYIECAVSREDVEDVA
jgi:hypothetical protein